MKCHDYIEGVPGVSEDKEAFQGIDRLVDTMINDEFAFLVVAKYLTYNNIQSIEKSIYQFYNTLSPYAKKSIQTSENNSKTTVNTNTTGNNGTYSLSKQKGTTKNYGTNTSKQRSVATNYSQDDETRTESVTTNYAEGTWTETDNTTETNGNNKVDNTTTGTNITKGDNKSTNREFVYKDAQEWMKYIDDVLLKRLDYGKGKGIYLSTIAIAAQGQLQLKKVENTVSSLFSSGSGNKVPIMKYSDDVNIQRLKAISNFQIPLGNFESAISDDEICMRSVLSQYAGHDSVYCGNWFSTDELSIITGLPQKEIIGLPLREEVEFGLNIKNDIPDDKIIKLGSLIQSGQEIKGITVSINRDDLDKHTFVTGVTGSGKTTTCQSLLINAKQPFCVIEPAKTEYRIMRDVIDDEDVLIFTLGRDKVTPFRLNPFEFLKHESISAHVDMIKASIEAAFDMEAAIPQIIETALYRCYEDCGWDIADDSNSLYEDPFAPGVYSFPTFSELINKTVEVVKEQGFDERLKADYIGSIRARLMGLMVGSKGLMFNTYRSFNFRDLIHRRIVIELEDIRSTEEKSLIMGFLISNLMEAIRAEYYNDPQNFRHITLIEEAHRLLSKYQPGDPFTKKQGVEMFSNMLAEVRKYGESLVIVDQVPSKLATDVLKNTNTKIVHKIFAQDDKEEIGNTMSMTDEQKSFLSSLDTGKAIVYSQGWKKPVQTNMFQLTNTTSSKRIPDDSIRQTCLNYLYDNWNVGIVPGVDCFEEKPDKELFMKNVNNINMYRKLCKLYKEMVVSSAIKPELKDCLKHFDGLIDNRSLAKYIFKIFYIKEDDMDEAHSVEYIEKMITKVKSEDCSYDELDEEFTLFIAKRMRRI